jgi:Mrp family chromosome partitioning ATPase/capsular polysaccharide biosynthesis protein
VSQIGADLRPYLSVLARRWTVIVPAIVVVPLVALVLASGQQKQYSASSQVLLTYSSPGASLNGLATPYPGTSPDRNVSTQAALARDPAVAQQALILSRIRGSGSELLANSSVSSPNDSDLLEFTVEDSSPARAETLATNYARAYTSYRTRIDTQAITSALAGVNRQLADLAATGQTGTATYGTLGRDQQALIATAASGTSDVVLAQPAQSSVQVGPHPARSAAVGLGVGVILGLALAFLMETFDQRVAGDEIERRLKIPRLASIPASRRWRREVKALIDIDEPRRRDRTGASLALLDDPNGREAKAFRVLKSSLDLARLEHDFKSLLFTSARAFDGQAETVANLAITLAQSGQHVLLCDLSARQPAIGDLFELDGRPGVTELIRSRTPLPDAVATISDDSLLSPAPALNGGDANGGHGGSPGMTPTHQIAGRLDVLPFGGPAPHSGFLGTRAVTELIEQLNRAPYDLVLIDAPPLLSSGEAQTLSTLADAVIIALPDPIRLRVVESLSGTVSRLPMLALGFVSVGASRPHSRTRPSGGGGGLLAPAANPDLAPVTPIGNGHQYRFPPPGRRFEGFRNSSRFADTPRDS